MGNSFSLEYKALPKNQARKIFHEARKKEMTKMLEDEMRQVRSDEFWLTVEHYVDKIAAIAVVLAFVYLISGVATFVIIGGTK